MARAVAGSLRTGSGTAASRIDMDNLETRDSMAYERQGGESEVFQMIRPGWEIFGSDGEKIGDVDSVEADYLVVSEGLIFTSQRYIPASAVLRVDQNAVLLSVTKDEIDARGWDSLAAIRAEREPYIGDEPRSAEEPGQRTAADHESLELREEEIRARKRTVQSGEVDVSKDVVTEREEMDVPRRHEEVDIDYRPSVERRRAEGEIGEDEEIHVPLHEEQVDVEKETVVSGEVDINKREVEDTEHISEEVRKERLRVEREGDVTQRDTDLEEERRG